MRGRERKRERKRERLFHANGSYIGDIMVNWAFFYLFTEDQTEIEAWDNSSARSLYVCMYVHSTY